MKTTGYFFYAGALLSIIAAALVALSIKTSMFSNILYYIALIIPSIYYLLKCPSNTPIKKILWINTINTVLLLLLLLKFFIDVYKNDNFHAIENHLKHIQYSMIIIELIIMFYTILILGQIIKLSKTGSFVWWMCIINLILSFKPLFIISTIFILHHMNIYSFITRSTMITTAIDRIGLALLYISIGRCLVPPKKIIKSA